MANREEPIYNIGVVSRMTDIPSATLRIWERRYGFPEAARTEGRHRLYSDKQVERLLWVKARTDEGMQISQAIKALQLMEEQESASTVTSLPPIAAPEASSDGPAQDNEKSYIHVLQQRLNSVLVAHDTDAADRIFEEAMLMYPPEDIILQMIRPTINNIGEGWLQGNISISTEHMATNYLRQRLLVWMRTGPPHYPVASTVLACAPGEWHEGSLMMLGALLSRRRWPVTYIGQSVPLPDLAAFVMETQPLAVVFVAMIEEPARVLAEWPKWLPTAAKSGRPIVCYGGRIFNVQPELRETVPGLFLGQTLSEGVDVLERALRAQVSPVDVQGTMPKP